MRSRSHARADVPGSADVPVGNINKEWYSRGYLPHRDLIGLQQSITFRLADSLPQDKLRTLEEELLRMPEKTRSREQRKRIEDWLDSGLGCCALEHPQLAAYVEKSLLHFDGDRYDMIAWCIMPNHVHVLIEVKVDLATIVQGWKSYTARWALAHNEELALGIPSEKRFWMREYWDRYIRNEKHFNNVLSYIHMNPVKAGLCQRGEDWRWSSARFFERG